MGREIKQILCLQQNICDIKLYVFIARYLQDVSNNGRKKKRQASKFKFILFKHPNLVSKERFVL